MRNLPPMHTRLATRDLISIACNMLRATRNAQEASSAMGSTTHVCHPSCFRHAAKASKDLWSNTKPLSPRPGTLTAHFPEVPASSACSRPFPLPAGSTPNVATKPITRAQQLCLVRFSPLSRLTVSQRSSSSTTWPRMKLASAPSSHPGLSYPCLHPQIPGTPDQM
jgi:hypothetical protein